MNNYGHARFAMMCWKQLYKKMTSYPRVPLRVPQFIKTHNLQPIRHVRITSLGRKYYVCKDGCYLFTVQ